MYPHGRRLTQRRQMMTTPAEANAHALAVEDSLTIVRPA
jgi:hypothetical protein